ncbi:hypothetical protein ILUMI_18494 [Ignelater luminosus]|uniref:Uncharacterized protein n=1 Tax=Ignelater luminosus TaxID=2038154 RepID=A0A8K0CHX1_IGNLU|nr:hypothetical protein ILUMI_18494 [Ignelater luminosus]
MEMEEGRGKISRNYDKKLTGKSGDENTMTEMVKKIEWNTGKQAVNKYQVKAANLTRKTKKIKQSKNIIKVAKKYGVDIVALQEMKQSGSYTVEIGDYVILSSGCEQKIFGMGFGT